MKTFIASHRAGLGVAAFAALPIYALLPDGSGRSLEELGISFFNLLVLGVVVLGGYALYSSPYFKILYREAPLRRATTGVTDLDERELALRDRAAGLTYNLFAAANVVLLFGTGVALDAGWLAIDGDVLMKATMPYVFFASALPALMLEWFEPSAWYASAEIDEEEEDGV